MISQLGEMPDKLFYSLLESLDENKQKEIVKNVEKLEDNFGQIKGGKKAYSVNFEKFTLVEYGTQTDEKTCRFLSSLCPIWIPEPEEETYIGKIWRDDTYVRKGRLHSRCRFIRHNFN